jgi:L-ascorbate metabolism protein UlaG (beta-lactamase superfamily)
MALKTYGKLPSGARLNRIKRSENYRNGAFQNLTGTTTLAEGVSVWKTLGDFMSKDKQVRPPRAIPHVRTALGQLPADRLTCVWFGHSSYLLKVGTLSVLVDPVLSGHASPFPFMIRAFPGSDAYKPEDMPEVDILLITHDHYDHLDYRTIVRLKDKIGRVVCSLGVGAHLEHWGLDSSKIHELDWWERFEFRELSLTATPGRHFSGRGLRRAQSLWSSFVLSRGEQRLFLGGDSGYGPHFKTIGERYASFDMAILESGQYNRSWPDIHMSPEQTVQASADLNAKVLLPVHWAKFSLAMHAWNEPIRRVLSVAEAMKVQVATPKIGEPFSPGDTLPSERWWEF